MTRINRENTSDNTTDTLSQYRQESSRILQNIGNSRNRQSPASREEWAEVLATADKYY